MSAFEDKLLGELRAVVAERPEPDIARMRRRRGVRAPLVKIAGVAVLAAVASVVAVGVRGSGDATPSAFAVERNDDGTVTVTIRSLRDADGLESRMREVGIPAVVDYEGSGAVTCMPDTGPNGSDMPRVPLQPGDTLIRASKPSYPPGSTFRIQRAANGEVTFTVSRAAVRSGERLYITTGDSKRVSTISASIGATRPMVPCVPAKG